ncbi:MAG TPA: hypothetical protein VE136_01060 [Anaerolineales bacterium]|jgi:hypothetical protein|nr:hypothetical protein [Anaerolineales bacterium]
MKPYAYTLAFSSLLLIGLLSACSLPAPGATATQNVVPEYTAAAQTIIAQLTQAAGTMAPSAESPTQAPETITSEPGSETPSSEAPTETPTPTESQESTSTPTPTATPTPTNLPSDPGAALGEPDFLDTFQNGDNWALYEDDHVRFRINDGTLRMVAFNPELWDGFVLSWPVIDDFYLEMTATTKTCSGRDNYGLVARAGNSDNGYAAYLFGISCDGRYSLRIWDGENFTRLVDWTESEHIEAGSDQTNRIGFMADGDILSLYANGSLLEKTQDDTFDEGKFGVFVGSANTSDFTVLDDEIAYWELP